LVEAGTRFVDRVAEGCNTNHSWDYTPALDPAFEAHAAPMSTAAWLPDRDWTSAACSRDALVSWQSAQPAARRHTSATRQYDGRDHWPYCYTGVIGRRRTARLRPGKSDKTQRPVEGAIHRRLLATIYHSVGISKRSCTTPESASRLVKGEVSVPVTDFLRNARRTARHSGRAVLVHAN